jgi:hypothetical protein
MICPNCGHSEDRLDRDPTQRQDSDGIVLPVNVIGWIVTFAVFATLFSLR